MHINRNAWLSLAILLLLASSCYPRKRNVPMDQLGKLIEMHKGACFGTCPVYGLVIYENGKVSFDGRMNTDKLGVHSKQLSKKEFKSIQERFEQANLSQYEDNYRSDIHDLPSTKIVYHGKGKSKSIKGDVARPDAVKELEKQLQDIAQSDGWTLVEPLKDAPQDNIVAGEIIVEFHPSADIPDWVHKMEAYGLQLKRQMNKKGNLWLVTYDTSKISPADMLFKIKDTKEVYLAEHNRKVRTR
ncbi:MAG: DUF6438 domain-containing protein [Bacteroidota bacterium]